MTKLASFYLSLAILLAGEGFTNALADLPERWVDPLAVEQRIWRHLQENAKENFTSIRDVKCNETRCQVRFTGTEIQDNQDLYDKLVVDFVWTLIREEIPVRQVAMARTEISPGVTGTIITFSSKRPPPKETWIRTPSTEVAKEPNAQDTNQHQ